ncbi:MAG TPA: glycosyltransferase family 2 protein [Casimicrobiaceae bacterium]|nr:glycosyltransferase family 2 protein [Casimicrobiaceae bacterium]
MRPSVAPVAGPPGAGCSVVVPVYRNRESLPELLDQLEGLDRELGGRLEAVFVVDGSPDDSFAWLRDTLPTRRLRSTLIGLSRNFGSFAAIRAGMTEAAGPQFAVMAADLQDPPELVRGFFEVLDRDAADVVIGERTGRNDPWTTRLASDLFWRAYRRLVQPQIPVGGVDLFGCNQRFRDNLIALDELNSSLVGLVYWLGFRRASVPYERRPRPYGKSAWSWRRKLRYLADSVFSFSDLPIRLALLLGALGLAVSLVVGIAVLIAKFAGGIDVPGYAATMLIIVFFGALNMVGLGIIGAYTWRAFENTKRRPGFVIANRARYDGTEGRA